MSSKCLMKCCILDQQKSHMLEIKDSYKFPLPHDILYGLGITASLFAGGQACGCSLSKED